MKQIQPQVVISIGDYHENYLTFHIKQMYPQLFKWVSVLAVCSLPINEKYKDSFDFADYVVLTNKESCNNFLQLCHQKEFSYLPFGPDEAIYSEVYNKKLDVFRVVSSLINSFSLYSLIGSVIFSVIFYFVLKKRKKLK